MPISFHAKGEAAAAAAKAGCPVSKVLKPGISLRLTVTIYRQTL